MRTVRRNVFETNSSSCHSVTVMAENAWEKFKNFEVVLLGRPMICEHEECTSIYEDDEIIPMSKVLEELKAWEGLADNVKDVDYIKNISLEDFVQILKDNELDDYGSLYDFFYDNDYELYSDDCECGWDTDDIRHATICGTKVVVVEREVCC